MKKEKPTYIMVPRKLVTAWIASFLSMLIVAGSSIQWSNYIDRRSNQRWCGLVGVLDDTYKTTPPPSETGKKVAIEIHRLRTEFNCK